MIRRSGWAEGWFMRTTYEPLRKNMFGTQLAWSILVTVFWSKATVKQLRICYWAFHLRFEQRKSNFSLIYLRSRRLSNFSCTQNFESLWISTPLTVSFQHRSRTSAPRISEIPNLEKPIIFKWNHWFNFGRVFFFQRPNSWRNMQWIARLDFSGQFGGLESVCLLCWSHDSWWEPQLVVFGPTRRDPLGGKGSRKMIGRC